jgi:NhaA family Na+:H+ antiporter
MSERPSIFESFSGLFRLEDLRPIDRLVRPLRAFARHKLAGAGLLMLATAVAIIWANSPWQESYHHLLHLELSFRIGDSVLSKTLHHWINDGLMGIFFFMVGLEIKRELLVGELSTVRKASLPAIAALGGMIVPALLYSLINRTAPGSAGWGIPMATDIAFALGVLALLGDRVPLGLKVFLTALAIVDDIGAVLVIAIFYTSDLALLSLVGGLGFCGLSIGLNKLKVQSTVPYFVVGVCCWLCFLESGVHATIAALLISFTIPARTRIDGEGLVERLKFLIKRLEEVGVPNDTKMNSNRQQHLLDRMSTAVSQGGAPLQRIEHSLAGPVTFFVLPLFALANAGVTVHGGLGSELLNPVALGIVFGLFFGKLIGVTAATWLAVKLGVADMPAGVTWGQIVGVAFLAGIGFTMALFVSGLAFGGVSEAETAKVGILVGSIISGAVGYLVLRRVIAPESSEGIEW